MFCTSHTKIDGGEYFMVPAKASATCNDQPGRQSTLVRLRLSWSQGGEVDNAGAILFAVSNGLDAASFYQMQGPSPEQACSVQTCLDSLSSLVRSRQPGGNITPAQFISSQTYTNHKQLTRCLDFQRFFADDDFVLDCLERDYAVGYGFALLQLPLNCSIVSTAWSSLSSAPVLLVAGPRAHNSSRLDLVVAALNGKNLWWSNGTNAVNFTCVGENLKQNLVVPSWTGAAPATSLHAIHIQVSHGSALPTMHLVGNNPVDQGSANGMSRSRREQCCIS